MEQYASIRNLLSTCLAALKSQLDIEQSALESAKTEVENTITGTPELLAVSDAQQVRLDRQIEQFEELQRVLVRV
jgi:5-methylcytosine-specific restriction endonuclease McrBC regulatory subunit McrC